MKNLICLTTLLLFISSCSKDPCSSYQSKTYSYFLNDSTKAQIPFKGFDTLMFISNKGDTALLIGSKKYNYTDIKEVNTSGNLDCRNVDIYKNEFLDVRYLGSNPNLHAVFYSLTVDNWNDEYTIFTINYEQEFRGLSFNYNNPLSYVTPVNIGSQIINGRNIDRKDGTASFTYNKIEGILQIRIADSLIYTLNK